MFKTGDKVVRVLPYNNPTEYDEGFMREGSEYTVELGGDFVISLYGNDFTYQAAAFELVKPAFKNMKFRVSSPEHSKEIQEALFEMGYKWQAFGMVFKFLGETESTPWLHTDEDGILYRSWQDPDDEFSSISPFRHQEYVVETTKSYKIIPVEISKPEVITIDGKTYDKEAVLKRLAELEVV